MTSTAAKLPWKVHPWRVSRLPTLPTQEGVSEFFTNRKRTKIKHFKPPNSSFEVRLKPIKPLLKPSTPHERGPVILRAFLYARRVWPGRPFSAVASQALEAIYNSL